LLTTVAAFVAASFVAGDVTATGALRGIVDGGSETRKLSEEDGSAPIESLDGSDAGLEERRKKRKIPANGTQRRVCGLGQCWYVDVFPDRGS
jgi:hypothetical protein